MGRNKAVSDALAKAEVIQKLKEELAVKTNRNIHI
jgi:hypothetical protein